MKKKLLIGLAAVILMLGIALTVLVVKGLWFSVGPCIMAENGHCLLVMGNTPVKLSNHTLSDDPFGDLDTGDRILVLHDGIAETYPAQSGAYLVVKIGDDGASQIPISMIEELTELGWVIDD